jgi:hypothetical protein
VFNQTFTAARHLEARRSVVQIASPCAAIRSAALDRDGLLRGRE